MRLRGLLSRLSWVAAVRAGGVIVLCAVAAGRRPWWPPDALWLVALLAAGFGSRVFLRHLAPFLALFVLYFVLSGLADDLNPVVNYLPMVRFDLWLAGGGELPTRWLQSHLWDGSLRWYDFGLYLLYTAHFVVPLVVAVLIWKRRPRLYWTYVGAIMGLSFAAFVTYVLFPAAPPWLASDHRLIPPIHRISHDIWQAVGIADPDLLYSRLSPNLVAAVPSLHASYPLLILVFLVRAFGARRVWWVAAYPAALWIGIVYMGEHYVFDIVAGVAYTLAACVLAFWTADLVSRRRDAVPPAGGPGRAVEGPGRAAREAGPYEPPIRDGPAGEGASFAERALPLLPPRASRVAGGAGRGG
ncbi:phosphatase PAP2 family protein [Actinocorallia aurantiaca]|uniref:Inositolphosphotransferase Aur1/Ipt1 domain-containing protein n=1 Tax=Actinocorallia aurantiaca TaxID=46204 RepID=A0ABN3U0A1_9ACTN